jgi:hypothetical protein
MDVQNPPNSGADPQPAEAPIRPRFPRNRDVDKQAAALAEKHALPQPPSKILTWEQMMEYLALLTPEMWSHILIYVYRLRPRIIRQLKDPDAPNYIDCLGEPFTLEYLTERHGGGKYMLEAADRAITVKGNANHLFRCFFQIDEIRSEPKLNYEELDINARENMSYIQMLQHRGVLDRNGRLMQNQQQPAAAAGVNADVIKEILGFVSKLNSDQQEALRSKISTDQGSLGKSVGDILLEKMRQDDPSKQVQMLSGMLTALKEIVGTSKNNEGGSALYDRIIQMQSEHNKTVLQLIERIAGRTREPNEPGNDEFDRLDKVLGFAEKLAAMRGGGGRRTGWDVGLDYAKELGVPILQTIGNLFTLRRGGQPIAPGAPTPAPQQPQFDPYANPQAMRAHATAMTAQQPNPAPMPEPPGPPPPMPPGAATASTQLLALMQQYGNLVINALNNGTRGCDFADYVSGLLGNGTHAMISGHGEENLVQAMLAVPEIAMFGEPRLRSFTHEFVHYEDILQKEEGDEDQEPA